MLFTPESGSIPAVKDAGGKGSGLYWLGANGFPAPATWVLGTAAFDRAIEHASLTSTVDQIDRATATWPDWSEAQAALDRLEPQRAALSQALCEVAWPEVLSDPLIELPYAEHTLWAVRSSATVEDSTKYSYAGHFHSKLSVPSTSGAVAQAVREVWASTFNREVLAYRAQFATPLPRMAVILQPMQPITAGERSGVIFSHSPVPVMPGVLVQATFGSGRGVVAGHGGDLYTLHGRDVTRHPLPPPHITLSGASGGEVIAPTPFGPPLTQAEVRQLAAHVLSMAERWGKPVNAEFIWYAGQPEPLFVQVRQSTAGTANAAPHNC